MDKMINDFNIYTNKKEVKNNILQECIKELKEAAELCERVKRPDAKVYIDKLVKKAEAIKFD